MQPDISTLRPAQVDDLTVHLNAGLDRRDLPYLAVNPDRRRPTTIKAPFGHWLSID